MSFSWPRPWPRTFSRYWEEQTGAAVLPKLWLSFLAVMPAHFSVSYTSAWWLTQPPYVIKKIITVSSFYLIAVIHQFEVRRLTQPYRKCVSKSHFPGFLTNPSHMIFCMMNDECTAHTPSEASWQEDTPVWLLHLLYVRICLRLQGQLNICVGLLVLPDNQETEKQELNSICCSVCKRLP